MDRNPEVSFYLKDKDFKDPPENIYYLLASSGLFKVTKTAFFQASTLTFAPRRDRKLGILRAHKEELKLGLSKKIPFGIFKSALDFFRERCRTKKEEAFGLIYWMIAAEKYKLVLRKSKKMSVATPVSVEAFVGRAPKGMIRVGDMHSHALWPAFHSRLDDDDEDHDDGLHLTVGEVLDKKPSVSCSVVVDGVRFLVSPKDIFEAGEFKEISGDEKHKDDWCWRYWDEFDTSSLSLL